MSQHSERPSPADQPNGPVPHPATTDESAAESGQPADMAYYRIPGKSGAMMLLGTIAIPLAVIVGIVVVLLLTL